MKNGQIFFSGILREHCDEIQPLYSPYYQQSFLTYWDEVTIIKKGRKQLFAGILRRTYNIPNKSKKRQNQYMWISWHDGYNLDIIGDNDILASLFDFL